MLKRHAESHRLIRGAAFGATIAAAVLLSACGSGATAGTTGEDATSESSTATDGSVAMAPANATATTATESATSAPSTSAATTTTPLAASASTTANPTTTAAPTTTNTPSTAAPSTTAVPTTAAPTSTTVAPTTTAAQVTTTVAPTTTTAAPTTTTAPVTAEKVKVAGVGVSDRLNVRDGAGSGGSIVGTLGPNQRGFDAFETTNGWTRISAGSVSGWVNGTYLDGWGSCSTGTAPTAPVGPNYDVDGDGVLDTIWQTSPTENADGLYHLNAVLAATGEHIETVLDEQLRHGGVSDLGAATDLTGDGVREISTHYNLGATTSTWRFFSLAGCEFQQLSTSAGDPFEVNHGASVTYVVSIACTSASGTSGGGVAHRTTTLDQSTSSPVFNAVDRVWIWDGSAMTLDSETSPAPSPGQPHGSLDTNTCQS